MTHTAFGMDLSGWYSEAVIGATAAGTGEFKVNAAWRSEAPNICVLPRFAGEKPRSTWKAIQTHWGRGSGQGGDLGFRALMRRVPAWMAWMGFQADVVNPLFHYSQADEKPVVIPISALIRSSMDDLRNRSPRHNLMGGQDPGLWVVAMPDHFQERAQENLLAALPHGQGGHPIAVEFGCDLLVLDSIRAHVLV